MLLVVVESSRHDLEDDNLLASEENRCSNALIRTARRWKENFLTLTFNPACRIMLYEKRKRCFSPLTIFLSAGELLDT